MPSIVGDGEFVQKLAIGPRSKRGNKNQNQNQESKQSIEETSNIISASKIWK